ncbi:hypothetical protein SRHO_G00186940 [Serrasalmus rhombeus]
MEQGPRRTPGFLGSVPRTVRFQWRDIESGDTFPDRVPFIREVLFGALGLGNQDLICAQRNNAARFFDVIGGGVPAGPRERGGRYLFYRGQPAFCRGCLQHGHKVSGCRDVKRKNCLGQGLLAKDCKNPRRCKSCGGEGHLAHSCPRQEATYAIVLAGAGGGPVGEEGLIEDRAEESIKITALATATSSPGGPAGGPAPGRPPLTGKEAPSISRPVKKSRKRRRAHEEEMEKRQRAGSPGAAPEGAPLSPPVPPNTRSPRDFNLPPEVLKVGQKTLSPN